MPKFFTLTEAESLLPSLEGWLRTAIDAKDELLRAEESMQGIINRIREMGGVDVDVFAAARMRSTRIKSLERFQGTVKKIEEVGCLVKDLDTGLIDFPSLLEGEEVYLCWKLGETHIGFWHRIEEGFSGRKPIEQTFGGDEPETLQ